MVGDAGLEPDETEYDDASKGDGLNVLPADLSSSSISRLELVWPGKDLVGTVQQTSNGEWKLLVGTTDLEARPIIAGERHSTEGDIDTSLLISGDRIACLRSLARIAPNAVMLAYVDVPRVRIDNADASFRGEPQRVLSAWLSVLRTHLVAIRPLLAPSGVVVVHVGEAEAALARMVTDELFRGQHVGTVVWQRSYAPRNMKGMREFTATHDCLIIYAKEKEKLRPVGLRRLPSGYSNPDGDPRGPWKAEHKGAASRRENSDFDTFVPPYRWRLVEGNLPSGLWRVSPLTGVIWGEPTESGEFPLTIEIADSEDKTHRKKLVISIEPTGKAALAKDIPWLFREIETGGKLRIETEDLPVGAVGERYSAILLGAGGSPFTAKPKRPGPGRYWEFARDTLVRAYLEDSVHLGRDKPTAIPHPKAYSPPSGELVVENQQTWWPGRISKSEVLAGYTEDATKHLRALAALGAISTSDVPAKPEPLLARLIQIFTEPGDLVLEPFSQAADLAAVALKFGRRFIALNGSATRDRDITVNCAIPRLKAVIDGVDFGLEAKVPEMKLRADGYVPFGGGGGFATAELGEWVVRRHPTEDLPELNAAHYQSGLEEAILASHGFLPIKNRSNWGRSFVNPHNLAVVLPPAEYLTSEKASAYVELFAGADFGTLFYFRSSDDFDPTALPDNLKARRVPYELGV